MLKGFIIITESWYPHNFDPRPVISTPERTSLSRHLTNAHRSSLIHSSLDRSSKMKSHNIFFIPALIVTLAGDLLGSLRSCVAQSDNIFVFSIDLLEGATGYYRVEGHDGVQPEITMIRGETYVFDQLNSSNWFHPLGFAYYPDGAHDGVDELEEGVGNGDAPVYVINGELSDLDTYEPQFFYPEEAWLEQNYTVNLTVTDPNVTEIFYFCHIHDDMSGRINIIDAEGDEPAEPEIDLYEPMVRSEFDVECGSFGSVAYAPREGTFESELCPNQKFFCGDPDDTFGRCMHAIDCKMNYEMRIERASDASNTVAFMHQMIPHHENAVNMAKVLLLNPGDEDLDEEVAAMLREIVNTQNAQITFMRGYLEEQGHDLVAAECENDDDDDNDVPGYAIGIMTVLGVLCLVFLATLLTKAKASRDEKKLEQNETKMAMSSVDNSQAAAVAPRSTRS